MKPSVYTYNAHKINDGTNYTAHLLLENQGQGSAEVNNVKRPFNRPVYGGKTLNNYEMVLLVHMLGTWQTQVDTLKGWFNIEDQTQHALIVKDTNNSNKQWFVMATPRKCILLNNTTMVVTLDVADPVWMAVSESSSGSWGVTASGQTWSVTAGGNVNAHPRITITPTAVKGAGYAYKRNVIIRNRVSEPLVNYPFELTNAGWDATALLNYTTNHVHINVGGGIAADTVTIPYDGEGGTLPTSGLAMIENEQIRYTGKSGGNLTGCTRGVNGTTAATHADDVQINQSMIQADGDDIRVFVDGKQVPCWTYGVGTSAQKVWISLDLKAKVETEVSTAVDDGALADGIVLKKTDKFPNKGYILIGTELLRYTGNTTSTDTLTGITRGANGTTAASHAANASVYFIEHDIWIYYGNLTLDDPTTNYENWDAKKPIMALSSTNVSWVYATFRDAAGQRAGSWSRNVLDTDNNNDTANKTRCYTGARNAMASTATEMGAIISAWKSGATWKSDNATLAWSLYNPCGFTTATASGEKYRVTTNWPAKAYLEYSDDGDTWNAAWTTEATPGSATTWTALSTHSAVSLGGTYEHLRFIFAGSVGATANNYAAISYTDVTLVPDTNYIPLATLGDEASNYHLNIRIRNTTTGESLKVDTGMLLNGTLEIDCKDKTVNVTSADSEKDVDKAAALTGFSSVRNQWLDLQPGANTLKIEDIETTGTLNLTVMIYWQDRNN
jgi:hypothetical protein